MSLCPRVLVVACALVLAACAESPPRPVEAVPASAMRDPAVDRAIARQRAIAERAQKSGDLARAAAQWQVITLLDPADARARTALAEIRAQIPRVVAEESAAGQSALRSGDLDRAAAAYVRVLAADPADADAARQLREIDRQNATRTQSERAARAAANSGMTPAPPSSRSNDAVADGYDLEQRIEMFRAGDTTGGLRELRGYVEAHPADRAARQQIGAVVYDRARELDVQGSREEALTLYEQAIALRGDKPRDWVLKAAALRRALGDEYYRKGVVAYDKDRALAIRMWETSLSFDPKNAKASERLAAARKPPGGTPAR